MGYLFVVCLFAGMAFCFLRGLAVWRFVRNAAGSAFAARGFGFGRSVRQRCVVVTGRDGCTVFAGLSSGGVFGFPAGAFAVLLGDELLQGGGSGEGSLEGFDFIVCHVGDGSERGVVIWLWFWLVEWFWDLVFGHWRCVLCCWVDLRLRVFGFGLRFGGSRLAKRAVNGRCSERADGRLRGRCGFGFLGFERNGLRVFASSLSGIDFGELGA